jgi:hypothetical protein
MYSNHGSNGRNFKDHNVNNEEHFTNSYRYLNLKYIIFIGNKI